MSCLDGRLFCSVTEAAAVLELDVRTLRRAIDAGDFPAVRVSGSVRVPVAHLLELAGLGNEDTAHAMSALAAPATLDGGTSEHPLAS